MDRAGSRLLTLPLILPRREQPKVHLRRCVRDFFDPFSTSSTKSRVTHFRILLDPQERPRRPPGDPQEIPRDPRRPPGDPRRPQKTSEDPQESPGDPTETPEDPQSFRKPRKASEQLAELQETPGRIQKTTHRASESQNLYTKLSIGSETPDSSPLATRML